MIIIISQNTKRREGIYTLKTDSTHKGRVFYNCVRHISRQRKEKGENNRNDLRLYVFQSTRIILFFSMALHDLLRSSFFFLFVLFRRHKSTKYKKKTKSPQKKSLSSQLKHKRQARASRGCAMVLGANCQGGWKS